MKTSKTLLKKASLLFLLIFISSISLAQENFKERELKFMQDVANNSNFNTIEKYMINNDYKFVNSLREQSDYIYVFENKYSVITIMYNSLKKLSFIQNLIPRLSIPFITSELNSNKFTIIKSDEDIDLWKKNNYPYQFAIEKTTEAGCAIILITKEYEEYVK